MIEDENLLGAVQELTEQVKNLSHSLQRDYPKRDEVTQQGRSRAMTTLAFGVLLILIAQLLTISTVSYCFLSPTGESRPACNIIPGYEETTNSGKARLDRFKILINQIEENQKNIEELQGQIATLKGRK